MIGPLRSMGPRGRSVAGLVRILNGIPFNRRQFLTLQMLGSTPANHLISGPPHKRRRSGEISEPFLSSQ